jgi:hypothetical protein
VAAVVAPVVVEPELRGGFRGRVRSASGAMSPTSRSPASAAVAVIRGFGGPLAR